MLSLSEVVSSSFLQSFFSPNISKITFGAFVDIEMLYEAILMLLIVIGLILFVIGIILILVPDAKGLFGGLLGR